MTTTENMYDRVTHCVGLQKHVHLYVFKYTNTYYIYQTVRSVFSLSLYKNRSKLSFTYRGWQPQNILEVVMQLCYVNLIFFCFDWPL